MLSTFEDTLLTYRPIDNLIPATWQSCTVSLDDNNYVHYRRTGGNKPPLLLIHSFQVDGRMWLRTAHALQDTYDCIMPDVRGHGLSSPMPNALDSNTLSDDMQTLIESLELTQPPIIIGHSMGAEIALRLACKIEAKQVILIEPTLKNIRETLPSTADTLPDYLSLIVEMIQLLKTLPHDEKLLMALSLIPPGLSLWEEHDFVSYVEGHVQFDINCYKLANKMDYIIESPDLIANSTCPTILLTAEQPLLTPDEFETAVSIFTDNWQHGQHIHFEDSGHFIPFDQFDRFIEVVRSIT